MATSKIPELGGKPGAATLTIVRGDQWRRPFTLRSGSATGDPIDLTGATLTAFIVVALGDAEHVAEVPLTVDDTTLGACTIDVTEETSALLVNDTPYFLVIRMVDSLDQARTLAQIRLQGLP